MTAEKTVPMTVGEPYLNDHGRPVLPITIGEKVHRVVVSDHDYEALVQFRQTGDLNSLQSGLGALTILSGYELCLPKVTTPFLTFRHPTLPTVRIESSYFYQMVRKMKKLGFAVGTVGVDQVYQPTLCSMEVGGLTDSGREVRLIYCQNGVEEVIVVPLTDPRAYDEHLDSRDPMTYSTHFEHLGIPYDSRMEQKGPYQCFYSRGTMVAIWSMENMEQMSYDLGRANLNSKKLLQHRQGEGKVEMAARRYPWKAEDLRQVRSQLSPVETESVAITYVYGGIKIVTPQSPYTHATYYTVNYAVHPSTLNLDRILPTLSLYRVWNSDVGREEWRFLLDQTVFTLSLLDEAQILNAYKYYHM